MVKNQAGLKKEALSTKGGRNVAVTLKLTFLALIGAYLYGFEALFRYGPRGSLHLPVFSD